MNTRVVALLGANGQIGAALLKRLAADEGVKAVAICRNAVGAGAISDVDCEVRLGSIRDEGSAKKLLDDCDVVVNCIWPVLPSREARLAGNRAASGGARRATARAHSSLQGMSTMRSTGSFVRNPESVARAGVSPHSAGAARCHLE